MKTILLVIALVAKADAPKADLPTVAAVSAAVAAVTVVGEIAPASAAVLDVAVVGEVAPMTAAVPLAGGYPTASASDWRNGSATRSRRRSPTAIRPGETYSNATEAVEWVVPRTVMTPI